MGVDLTGSLSPHSIYETPLQLQVIRPLPLLFGLVYISYVGWAYWNRTQEQQPVSSSAQEQQPVSSSGADSTQPAAGAAVPVPVVVGQVDRLCCIPAAWPVLEVAIDPISYAQLVRCSANGLYSLRGSGGCSRPAA
jgi:hypothetical protein